MKRGGRKIIYGNALYVGCRMSVSGELLLLLLVVVVVVAVVSVVNISHLFSHFAPSTLS